jgi:enediyne biosynthesis protein E4
MKKVYYLFLFSVIAITSVNAQGFWTGLNGPFGGVINDIVSPSAGVMVVSTANGIYRSTDSGANWTRINVGSDNSFTDLEIDPSSGGNKIYAGTTGGARFYISIDAGATWAQPVATGIVSAVNKIKITANGTIYMSDTNNRLLRSTNSGAIFTTPSIFTAAINDLDADNSNNIYVSTNEGIKVSTNGGLSFLTPSTGSLLSTAIVYSTVISGTSIFCLSSNGAHKSTNTGGVFALINTGLVDASYSGIIDLDASGNIFLCNNSFSKTYTSTAASGGASWTFVGSNKAQSVTASYFQNINTYYLGLGNTGFVRVTTNGSLFFNSSKGIKGTSVTNKIFVTTPNNYLFTSNGGLGYYYSYDNGTNWNYSATDSTNRSITGFIKLSDKSILGYGKGGAIRSTNQGFTWALKSIQSLAELVSSNGTNLFSYSTSSSGNVNVTSLLSSTDKGVTWANQSITGLPASPNPLPTKIQVDGTNNIYFKAGNEIYKVNAGTTVATKLVLSNVTTIQDFSVTGSSIFVLANSNLLFVSSDNGASFISKNGQASASAIWAYDSKNLAISTTANNFFISNDGGGIWIRQALIDAQATATDIFVTPEGFLYVPTTINSILYKSTNVILPPAAPTNLITIGKSFDRVELLWTDNSINESDYIVEFSVGNNLNYSIFNLGNLTTGEVLSSVNKVNVNVPSLTKETQYFFRVKAINSAGSSSYSNEISVTTLGQCASSIPNNKSWTATAVADPGSTPSGPGPFTSSVVNIVAVPNRANAFTISNFDLGIDAFLFRKNTSASIMESCRETFLLENLAIPNGNGSWNGTNTLVLKWQEGPYGAGPFQGTTTFVLNPTDPTPAIPTLNVYIFSSTEALLNWNTVPFTTQYSIERSTTSGGPYSPLATVNYPTTIYLDKNLTNGGSYYYRIVAKNMTSSPPSAEASVSLANGLFRPIENSIQLNFENQQGISWGDLDGDGDEDIASPSFTDNAGQTVPPVFYENMGNGKDFTRRDLAVLKNENKAISRGINIFDFNNDGKLDVYIARLDVTDLLLINNGAWDFTKKNVAQTEKNVNFLKSSAAADYDKDGLVDLFIGNSNGDQTLNNLLLKNKEGSSLDKILTGSLTTDLGDCRNVSWCDYDNDNDQDIFVLNSSFGQPNRLYKNNGDGTFIRVTGLIFDTDIVSSGRTISWGDIDNDGDFDLYIGSSAASVSAITADRLYKNNGDGTFSIVVSPVAELATTTLGSSFGDIDNDGDIDLIAINGGSNATFLNAGANSIFINDIVGGVSTFTKYSVNEMMTNPNIFEVGGAMADFDKDGFLDIYPAKGSTVSVDLPNFLYKNLLTNLSSNRNWIELKLIGTFSNKSAIGARITLTTNTPARTQIREISTQTGYGSANSLIVHFGIGTATTINNIQIKWPNGFVQNIANPTINQILTISEGAKADLVFTPPTTFDSKFDNVTFSVGATTNFGTISSVVLSYRKIGGTAFTDLPGVFNPTSNKWEFIIKRNFCDGNGLEYNIAAKSGANTIGRLPADAATNFYTYLNYSEADNSIPAKYVGQGGDKSNWKMFSIPFDLGNNKNVTTVFDELSGRVDKIDWRMVTYKDATAWSEFPDGFSTLNRGQGYFINIKNSIDIKIPAASTSNNRKDLFKMDLKKGWNQIGNPYLTPISWEDVVALNTITGPTTQLKTFSGASYDNATVLQPFEGGFVLADKDLTISIPFQGQTAIGGRKETPISNQDWLLPITLKQGEVENTLGGIGMHTDAQTSYDQFDDFNAPPIFDYIEINFAHPEHFVKRFARDVVPVQNEFTWAFDVKANQQDNAEIKWNDVSNNLGDKDLFLFDEGLQKIINMKNVTSYSLQPSISKNFKIYFGENVEKKIIPNRVLLSNAFPNPTNGETTVNFTLADGIGYYQVKLEIYDLIGKKITTLVEGDLIPGFYSTTLNANQMELASGLYTCILRVADEKGQQMQSQKIVITK